MISELTKNLKGWNYYRKKCDDRQNPEGGDIMKEMLNVECQMRAAETLRPLLGLSLRPLREPKRYKIIHAKGGRSAKDAKTN